MLTPFSRPNPASGGWHGILAPSCLDISRNLFAYWPMTDSRPSSAQYTGWKNALRRTEYSTPSATNFNMTPLGGSIERGASAGYLGGTCMRNVITNGADIDALGSGPIDVVSPLTVDCWANVNIAGSASPQLVSKATGSNSNLFLCVFGGQADFNVTIGGTFFSAIDPASFQSNKWVYLCATFDNSVLRLYKNAVLVASQAASGAADSSSNALTLGSNDSVGLTRLIGLMQNVAIWRRALSLYDIKYRYLHPWCLIQNRLLEFEAA